MDEGTRQLLESAVVDVESHRRLDDVKARARQRHTRGRLLAGMTAAVVAIVGVGGAIAVLNEGMLDGRSSGYSETTEPSPPIEDSQRAEALKAKIDRARLRVEALNVRISGDLHRLQVAKQSGDLLAIQRLNARLKVERQDVARVEALMRYLMDRLQGLFGTSLTFPSASPGPGTESLAGVPFPVCRSVSIAGKFGSGDDVAWTFAKERVPGEGCERPGSQFIGVGTADHVDRMSKGTTPIMGLDGKWWAPYATPDVDGDGTDEIAVATAYPGSDWAIQVWLYRAGDGAIEPVWEPCGSGCRSPWNTAIGSGKEESGATTLGGLYCGVIPSAPAQGAGLVEWQVSSDIPTRVYATLWTPLNGDLGATYSATYKVQGPAGYPPTGEQSICGSSSHQPPEA
jgi:uncharacterized coiled-coil protein SlyX